MPQLSFSAWARRYAGACLALFLCFSITYHVMAGTTLSYAIQTGKDPENAPEITVIVDAGHGGEDCGAIGVSGVYEKDINLKIAEYLAADLRASGVRVIMTRTDDALLYDPLTVERGHKKLTDLQSRLEIAKRYPEALFVSIHMNSFPSPSSRGLQVWYAPNDPSRIFAESIQSSVARHLQSDNHRMAKKSTGSIYLLDRAEGCAVLVECGFLTNVEECAKLADPEYQKQLSFVLFCAMMEYVKENGR